MYKCFDSFNSLGVCTTWYWRCA